MKDTEGLGGQCFTRNEGWERSGEVEPAVYLLGSCVRPLVVQQGREGGRVRRENGDGSSGITKNGAPRLCLFAL